MILRYVNKIAQTIRRALITPGAQAPRFCRRNPPAEGAITLETLSREVDIPSVPPIS
jgi:hypothetical protein